MHIQKIELGTQSLLSWMKGDTTPEGCLDLAWTGQAGFILQTARYRLGIDLYLSDSLAEKHGNEIFSHSRMTKSPISAQELSACGLDMLLATHGHTDHLDPDTIKPLFQVKKRPLCIVPRSIGELALERGVPLQRMVLLNAGESFHMDQLSITAIASAHEHLADDADGNSMYLGYVMDIGGVRVFHSGDSVPYPGLEETLAACRIDIGLLPVNGRDAFRTSHGVLGNFTVEEAGDIVRKAGITVLIPHHVQMFSFNTVEPQAIAERLRGKGFSPDSDFIIPDVREVYRIVSG